MRKLDFLGLFHLFKLFLRYCYDPEDPKQDLFDHTYVPKPNDFTDFGEYFVRKVVSLTCGFRLLLTSAFSELNQRYIARPV